MPLSKNDLLIDVRFFDDTYEFNRLQTFINEEISAIIQTHYPLDEILIADLKHALKREVEDIKSRMTTAILKFREAALIEKYIQYHQRALIQMTGTLVQYVEAENLIKVSDTTGTEVLSQYMYSMLQNLMNFIEHRFSSYFDHQGWITENYRHIVVHHIQSKLGLVLNDLKKCKLDPELLSIISKPFTAFVENENTNSATYYQVIYLKDVLNELSLNINANNAITPAILHDLLVSLNFNSVSYFRYFTAAIKNELHAVNSNNNRIVMLFEYNTRINQLPLKSDVSLEPRSSSIKSQVLNWITCEIQLLEKSQAIYKTPEPSTPEFRDKSKYKLNISVKQLAYWTRLLNDACCNLENNENLFRFVTNNFSTEKSINISRASFHNAFYSPEESTITVIQNLLQRMLKQTEADRSKI